MSPSSSSTALNSPIRTATRTAPSSTTRCTPHRWHRPSSRPLASTPASSTPSASSTPLSSRGPRTSFANLGGCLTAYSAVNSHEDVRALLDKALGELAEGQCQDQRHEVEEAVGHDPRPQAAVTLGDDALDHAEGSDDDEDRDVAKTVRRPQVEGAEHQALDDDRPARSEDGDEGPQEQAPEEQLLDERRAHDHHQHDGDQHRRVPLGAVE